MLIGTAVFPPACWTAGSLPSGSLMQGPARPKHPDGERLFPYQSGNTAPPLHPLYKKHDSSIPKKMQEDQPDSRICQKPPEFLLSKMKNSRERRGWWWCWGGGGGSREERSGRGGKRRGCKTVSEAPGFIFLFILHRLRKGLHQQDRTWREGVGVGGGGRVAKNGTQNKTPGKQRMVEM